MSHVVERTTIEQYRVLNARAVFGNGGMTDGWVFAKFCFETVKLLSAVNQGSEKRFSCSGVQRGCDSGSLLGRADGEDRPDGELARYCRGI